MKIGRRRVGALYFLGVFYFSSAFAEGSRLASCVNALEWMSEQAYSDGMKSVKDQGAHAAWLEVYQARFGHLSRRDSDAVLSAFGQTYSSLLAVNPQASHFKNPAEQALERELQARCLTHQVRFEDAPGTPFFTALASNLLNNFRRANFEDDMRINSDLGYISRHLNRSLTDAEHTVLKQAVLEIGRELRNQSAAWMREQFHGIGPEQFAASAVDAFRLIEPRPVSFAPKIVDEDAERNLQLQIESVLPKIHESVREDFRKWFLVLRPENQITLVRVLSKDTDAIDKHYIDPLQGRKNPKLVRVKTFSRAQPVRLVGELEGGRLTIYTFGHRRDLDDLIRRAELLTRR